MSRRGVDPARKAAFSLPELDDLLQEWVIHWQMCPHDGLVHPFLPGLSLSPNDAYALQVATSGYLPMPLGPSDYIELLPVTWRVIHDYSIRIAHRTYDAPELAAWRRQPSGVAVQRGKWEVHYDPHDLSHVFVRNHRQRLDHRRMDTAAAGRPPVLRRALAPGPPPGHRARPGRRRPDRRRPGVGLPATTRRTRSERTTWRRSAASDCHPAATGCRTR
ncbi:Mu transposase C-terminal domain-containing protein [Streptomyces shenzhenensis]|uniref:Mu transposase C-terminal domain-containing protein n=1 Tax=Streptomyces shenzhenensis TaxID=943815 RepID=UPI00340E53D8